MDLSIRIPMKLRRHGGRKLVIVAEGLEVSAPQPAFDPVLINALVRAHRWRRQIENGEFRSPSELAAHEKIADSFVARMLCPTLLAPDITEAILEGRAQAHHAAARDAARVGGATADIPGDAERVRIDLRREPKVPWAALCPPIKARYRSSDEEGW